MTPSPDQMGKLDPATTVDVAIDIAAAPATIWRFFTEPAAFAEWLGHGAVLNSDGTFTITYPNGRSAIGTILEREPERLIVWTWGYAESSEVPPGTTEVRITLTPTATGTRVTLQHTGLPTQEQVQGHTSGWGAWIAQLAQLGAKYEIGAGLPRLIEQWSEAWNTTNADARDTALDACCEEACTFLDSFAHCLSREEIAMHIQGVQSFMPGSTLHAVGNHMQTQHWVHWAWEGRMGDQVIATGYNIARVSSGRKFEEVVGFWSMA